MLHHCRYPLSVKFACLNNVCHFSRLIADYVWLGSEYFFLLTGAQQDKDVCYFFREKKKCRRGDLCPFKHVDPDRKSFQAVQQVFFILLFSFLGNITAGMAEVFGVDDCDYVTPIPEPGSHIPIEITAIFSPSRFYCIFPYGSTALTNAACDSEGNLCVNYEAKSNLYLFSFSPTRKLSGRTQSNPKVSNCLLFLS
jgi:hypothetical protein